jgi:hypothetical protein
MQLPQSFTGGQGTLVPPAAEAHWLAAYVVARHEKAVAEQLALRAIESFLPLYRSLRYWKNRRAQVELPLFPSYLFVRISGAEGLRVLAVPGVVHIVTFAGYACRGSRRGNCKSPRCAPVTTNRALPIPGNRE